MKTAYTLTLFAALLAGGCVTEFEADLPPSQQEMLVVEGNIISDTTVTFLLSRTVPIHGSTEEQAPPEARIEVVGSDGYRSDPARSTGPGRFELTIPPLDAQTEYHLEIECEGEHYRSSPSRPLASSDARLSFAQPVEQGEVTLQVSTDPGADQSGYYLWTYTEDWEYTAHEITSVFFDPYTESYQLFPEPPFYFCWRRLNSTQLLLGTNDGNTQAKILNFPLAVHDSGHERFSVLFCITVTQWPLSKAGYEYYQNLRKQSEEMGGLFTPQPSQISGNMICTSDPSKRVIGQVEVIQNLSHDRLFIYPSQLVRKPFQEPCRIYDLGEIAEILGTTDPLEVYRGGYGPIADNLNVREAMWAKLICLDCRKMGGTKNKPDFWPNRHE